MSRCAGRKSPWIVALAAIVVSFVGVRSSCLAQQNSSPQQVAGVDNSRMGAYQALAELSFQAFQKKDYATAAKLARILERTWDQGEWHNTSDGSYCKADRETLCRPIDRALDAFINPMIGYASKAPDPAAVEAAYKDFLTKLKQADQ